jgi:hypothetical protein
LHCEYPLSRVKRTCLSHREMSASVFRNERPCSDFPYLTGAIRMAALSPITMMREPSMIMVIVLSALLATPAQTRNVSRDNYSIMVPERGTEPKQKVSKQKVSKQKVSNQKVSKQEQPKPRPAPKYKSPSGTEQQVNIPKPKTVNPPRASGSGSVYVPQTGQTFHQAGGSKLFRIVLHVAPTKLVFMARPAAPEAPIWALAFNNRSLSGPRYRPGDDLRQRHPLILDVVGMPAWPLADIPSCTSHVCLRP